MEIFFGLFVGFYGLFGVLMCIVGIKKIIKYRRKPKLKLIKGDKYGKTR